MINNDKNDKDELNKREPNMDELEMVTELIADAGMELTAEELEIVTGGSTCKPNLALRHEL